MKFDIYEEGCMVQGMDSPIGAHYIGFAYGETFIEACKNYIKEYPRCGGEIRKDSSGKEYACNWGCRWFSTYSEAAKSFG